VLFFGVFCYISVFFPLAPPPPEIFLPTPLIISIRNFKIRFGSGCSLRIWGSNYA